MGEEPEAFRMKALLELPHSWFWYCVNCDSLIGLGTKSTLEFHNEGKAHVINKRGHEVWLVYNDAKWSTHPDYVGSIVRS